MNLIRLGRISTIDPELAMVQVIYTDKDGDISAPLPYFRHEYKMPEIDELVITIHLSNGTSSGFVLGGYFNDLNKPIETGIGLYRKELSQTPGVGVIRYTDDEGLKLTAPKITLESSNEGNVTVAQLVELINKMSILDNRVTSLESKV